MTEQVDVKQATEQAKTALQDILRLMSFEATVEVFPGEEETLFHIESPDAGRLIGRNAQVLNALQFVLNRIMFRKNGHAIRCQVDVERYRERRKDRLLQDAIEASDRVIATGQPVRLGPMGASDRRVIHQALKDNPRVETYSESADEEGRKLVVVCSAGAAPHYEESHADTPAQ